MFSKMAITKFIKSAADGTRNLKIVYHWASIPIVARPSLRPKKPTQSPMAVPIVAPPVIRVDAIFFKDIT